MPTTPDLHATTTAVLVVDMQNDNLHPDGAFAGSGAADHAASQDVVRNVRAVLDAARTSGAAVFHNRIVAYPGRDVGGSNAPIFRMIGPESLKAGTWGAAVVDGLDPQEDELVLDRWTRTRTCGRTPRSGPEKPSAPLGGTPLCPGERSTR